MADFLSAASFWEPRHRMASAWMEHGPFAFWLMDAARPGNLVELGTHYGYSYFAMCQALQALGVACRCQAVDTWQGDPQAGIYGEDVYDAVRTHNEEHYADFSTLLRMSFDQALERFPDGTIDLLHIDGFHSYEQVSHDFASWLPKLSARGVVILHDIHVRWEGFGVYRLWEEVAERYPHFEFTHGYGLGVLAVGPDAPRAVQDLCAAEANPALAGEIRAAYHRLGAVIARRWEQEKLEAELRVKNWKLREKLKVLMAKLRRREEMIKAMQGSTSWRVTRPLRRLRDALRKQEGE